MKLIFLSLFIPFIFISCASKNIGHSNEIYSTISDMVDEISPKVKEKLNIQDVVLVPDFVNIHSLKNRTQLGFLLSDILKERLSSKGIVIREIKFAKQFELGKQGLTMLSRDTKKILSNKVTQARYAVVGSYSITNENINIFLKYIDMDNGFIYASSYSNLELNSEIKNLEGKSENDLMKLQQKQKKKGEKLKRPSRPHMVL